MTKDLDAERAKIAQQVADYLAKGGKIQQVPSEFLPRKKLPVNIPITKGAAPV